MPGSFRTLGRMARGLPPALQMTQEFSEGHGIEDAVWGHAAFTCYFDAPVHMVQLPDGVRVGINTEDAAVIERLLVPAPVEVEPRPCADGAVFRRCVLSNCIEAPRPFTFRIRSCFAASSSSVSEEMPSS